MIDLITPLIQRIDRKVMLVNAARHYKGRKSSPIWVLIRDICGVGSTTALAIGRELGWNPYHEIKTLRHGDPEVGKEGER